MTSPSSVLIAIAAGVTSAVLFAGIALGSTSAVGMALAAPIPVAIASLGWGSRAGFIAALVAAGSILAIAPSAVSALTHLLAIGLPAAVAGHLAGLARPREETDGTVTVGRDGEPLLDWYPLSRILLAIAGMAAGACIVLGIVLGYDPDAMREPIVEALGQSGASGISQDDLRNMASSLLDLIPYVQPMVLTLMLVVGLYLAAVVVRISGRMPRPKDDIPSAVILPRIALAGAAVGLVLALVGGPVGLMGAVVCGAALAAFTLAGLAGLHRRTRGRAGRGLILFTTYMAILILSFPLVLFAALGAYESWRHPQAGH